MTLQVPRGFQGSSKEVPGLFGILKANMKPEGGAPIGSFLRAPLFRFHAFGRVVLGLFFCQAHASLQGKRGQHSAVARYPSIRFDTIGSHLTSGPEIQKEPRLAERDQPPGFGVLGESGWHNFPILPQSDSHRHCLPKGVVPSSLTLEGAYFSMCCKSARNHLAKGPT